MSKKHQQEQEQKQRSLESTRDAVENAINAAKTIKDETWEELAAKDPERVSKWTTNRNITRGKVQDLIQKAKGRTSPSREKEKPQTTTLVTPNGWAITA